MPQKKEKRKRQRERERQDSVDNDEKMRHSLKEGKRDR